MIHTIPVLFSFTKRRCRHFFHSQNEVVGTACIATHNVIYRLEWLQMQFQEIVDITRFAGSSDIGTDEADKEKM